MTGCRISSFRFKGRENVTRLPVITRNDYTALETLARAAEQNLDTAIVLGWHADGGLYVASSIANGPEALWLLKIAEMDLLRIGADIPPQEDASA